MDGETNIEQTSSPEIGPARRGPGRPKGLPKPPGSGRKKGTPNRITRDIREAAAKHGPKALAALVKLLDAPDPKITTAAAREILDRAYGRPVSPTELTGKDGAPLNPAPEISDYDAARLIAFTLQKAAHECGETRCGPELARTPQPAEPEPADEEASERAAARWRAHVEAKEARPDERGSVQGGGPESPRVVTLRPRSERGRS